MNNKKLISLILILVSIFTFSSCKKEEIQIDTEIPFNNSDYTDVTEVESVKQINTTHNIEQTTIKSEDKKESEKNQNSDKWTTDMIIDAYKKAASQSSSNVKSEQKISLTDISFGDEKVNSVVKLIKPIISTVVSGNSTEFDGITGGYHNLVASDINTAEAYKKNSDTIIKIKSNEQTDISVTDINSGTVGHLISVVGDISSVLNQLSDSGLPIEIKKENISMVYTNPCANVTIDENGNIKNGTWSYTVTINLKDFTVTGSSVGNATVTIENVITVNGGFAE